MLTITYLLRIFSLRITHFLNPLWTAIQWQTALKFLLGVREVAAVEELEKQVRDLTEVQYTIALNLGRSAIQVALEAYQFPERSEVILCSFSCTGVIMPVVQAGLTPVMVDVDEDFNMSLDSVKQAVTGNTRAIIAPHLSGKFSRQMFDILSFAREKRIIVIEDAAQSFGLTYDGKWAGTFGDVGILSFNGGKNLMNSSGGLMITNDEKVIEYCRARSFPVEPRVQVRKRVLRFMWRYALQVLSFPFEFIRRVIKQMFASSEKTKIALDTYAFPVYGMSEVEAQLATYHVQQYDEINAQRKKNSEELLRNGFWEEAGVAVPDTASNIFTKFLVTTQEDGRQASLLRKVLRSHGVETEASYTPLHLRPPFTQFGHVDMTTTERLWQGAFALPVRPRLGNADMRKIMNILQGVGS